MVARLKPFLDGAPDWKREILEYSPTALSLVQKIAATPYDADQTISRYCDEIQAGIQSAQAVQSGLDEYRKLGPRNLLLRDGRIDVNAAPGLFFWIRDLLI